MSLLLDALRRKSAERPIEDDEQQRVDVVPAALGYPRVSVRPPPPSLRTLVAYGGVAILIGFLAVFIAILWLAPPARTNQALRAVPAPQVGGASAPVNTTPTSPGPTPSGPPPASPGGATTSSSPPGRDNPVPTRGISAPAGSPPAAPLARISPPTTAAPAPLPAPAPAPGGGQSASTPSTATAVPSSSRRSPAQAPVTPEAADRRAASVSADPFELARFGVAASPRSTAVAATSIQKRRSAVSPRQTRRPGRDAPQEPPREFDATLETILYSPERKLAIIEGRIVQIGDDIRGARIIDITPEAVFLRDAGGVVSTLSLGRGR